MSKLTPGDVKRMVENIDAVKDDPEVAHSGEDALYQLVLCAIRDGAFDARGLAREALKTRTLKFERWYA